MCANTSCTIRTPLDICIFYLLLKNATAVAETSNTTFLASVNFLRSVNTVVHLCFNHLQSQQLMVFFSTSSQGLLHFENGEAGVETPEQGY